MQFRQVVRKIQCLQSVYDREDKRTRQKMVWSFDSYDARSGRQAPPAVEDLTYGDAEQRVAWVKEIAEEIERMAAAGKAESLAYRPSLAITSMNEIVNGLKDQSIKLTDNQSTTLLTAARSLIQAIEGPAKAATAPRADRRAFPPELAERARALREGGATVLGVAETLQAEGHPVSKSWVQKVTAPKGA